MESKKGVIILGGFIQALALMRSLSEDGIPVYIAEEYSCIAGVSRYCRKFLKVPPCESAEFTDFLLKLAKKEKLQGWLLLPTDDHQVEALSRNKSALGEYYKVLAPTPEELHTIINKKELLEKARECGTNIPNTCYEDSLEKARNFRFPLIVRGTYGLSFYKAMHRKAFVVDSFEQLQTVLNSIPEGVNLSDVMIQELIPSREGEHVLSFTCFAESGDIKTFWMGQKLRERPIDNGTATFAESVMFDAVIDQARPLIKALGFSGACEIEYMYDHRDDRWNLIEINPRTWKWVGLAKACGIDYAKILYRFANGAEQNFPASYEVGIKWVDHLTDPVLGIKLIAARRISLGAYLKSFRGKVIPATWSWKDPVPSLYFPLYSLLSILSRKLKRK